MPSNERRQRTRQ